jgi:hypothetical protein
MKMAGDPVSCARLRYDAGECRDAVSDRRTMLIHDERLTGRSAAGLPLAAVLVFLGWILAAAAPAEAGLFKPATGRWCAYMATGLNDCSYATFEQCMATLSGNGGICDINPHARQYLEDPPRRKRGAKVPRY